MLLALTFALMLGSAQVDAAPATFLPPPTAAASVDEAAPVAVPPPSEKAMDYYRSGNVLWDTIIKRMTEPELLFVVRFRRGHDGWRRAMPDGRVRSPQPSE